MSDGEYKTTAFHYAVCVKKVNCILEVSSNLSIVRWIKQLMLLEDKRISEGASTDHFSHVWKSDFMTDTYAGKTDI